MTLGRIRQETPHGDRQMWENKETTLGSMTGSGHNTPATQPLSSFLWVAQQRRALSRGFPKGNNCDPFNLSAYKFSQVFDQSVTLTSRHKENHMHKCYVFHKCLGDLGASDLGSEVTQAWSTLQSFTGISVSVQSVKKSRP